MFLLVMSPQRGSGLSFVLAIEEVATEVVILTVGLDVSQEIVLRPAPDKRRQNKATMV